MRQSLILPVSDCCVELLASVSSLLKPQATMSLPAVVDESNRNVGRSLGFRKASRLRSVRGILRQALAL